MRTYYSKIFKKSLVIYFDIYINLSQIIGSQLS